jgi:hypothetical protein
MHRHRKEIHMEINTHDRDSRFHEAETDVDRGDPWLFREPDAPNPLTIVASGWSSGHTKLGEAEFLNGVDRDGKKWSVLVGTAVLTKRLIDGLVEAWDDDEGDFVVVQTEGGVQPNEVVSIKYLGDREGTKYVYPDFRVSRKPVIPGEADQPMFETAAADQPMFETAAAAQSDEIPF